MVRKSAGRKLPLRCLVCTPTPSAIPTHLYPFLQVGIINHVGNAGFTPWIPNSGKVRTIYPASRAPPLILRGGRWTSEEDAALLESVTKHGKRWYEVARALPGRTDDQCAKRYKEAVDPSIRTCTPPLHPPILNHCPCREGPLDGRRG